MSFNRKLMFFFQKLFKKLMLLIETFFIRGEKCTTYQRVEMKKPHNIVLIPYIWQTGKLTEIIV